MEEFFMDVLNRSITAGWLVLVIIGIRLIFRNAPKKWHCALWALVVLRLVCPFSIETELSLVPNSETITEDIFYQKEPEIASGIEVVDAVVNPVIGTLFPATPQSSVNPIRLFIDIAAYFWVLGMMILSLYSLLSWSSIRRKVREAVPVSQEEIFHYNTHSAESNFQTYSNFSIHNDEVSIWLCDGIPSPFLMGVIKPHIYLPSDMEEADWKYVIAHEKAHLARHDHWWKPLGFAVLTFYWFHPLLWAAYILFCRDMELACDEKVIDDMGTENRKSYANALINCSVSHMTFASCPLAFGEVHVKKRIKSVLVYKKPALWMSVAIIAAGVMIAVVFLTNPARSLEEKMQDAIVEQKGWQVLSQQEKSIEIKIYKGDLADEILTYFEDIYLFPERPRVYDDFGNKLYLESVNYENEEYLEFTFVFSYRIENNGNMLLPYQMVYNDSEEVTYTNCIRRADKVLTDAENIYQDAWYISGEGSGERFSVCIKADIVREAEKFVRFTVEGLNEIEYVKK